MVHGLDFNLETFLFLSLRKTEAKHDRSRPRPWSRDKNSIWKCQIFFETFVLTGKCIWILITRHKSPPIPRWIRSPVVLAGFPTGRTVRGTSSGFKVKHVALCTGMRLLDETRRTSYALLFATARNVRVLRTSRRTILHSRFNALCVTDEGRTGLEISLQF